MFTDTPTNTAPIRPGAVFSDTVFDSTYIDPIVLKEAGNYGAFTNIELSRISHILKNDFADISTTSFMQQIEQIQDKTKHSNDLLISALNNSIVEKIVTKLSELLSIVTNTEPQSKEHNELSYKVISFIDKLLTGDEEKKTVNIADIISKANDIVNIIVKQYIPEADRVVTQLQEALYFADITLKQLELFNTAGQIKLSQLPTSVDPQPVGNTKDALHHMNEQHTVQLFKRRIDNIKVHIETLTLSMFQAQTVLQTLQHMLLNMTSVITITIPSYLQQVSFMNTMSTIGSADVVKKLEDQRKNIIIDLTSIIKH
jgi:hypothetical protein